MLDKKVIYVTGMPRAGSTLLCQLLGMHRDIYSLGHSSPLANVIEGLRAQLTNSPFFLSQVDLDFELAYERLRNTYHGTMNGWMKESDKPFYVDKNRGWLAMVETVKALDEDFRMLVCIRDPVHVYASVEEQHSKTILLGFPDETSVNMAYTRVDTLFAPGGVIGGPLKAIEAMQDISSVKAIKDKVLFVSYERLIENMPMEMSRIFGWLGADPVELPNEGLLVKPHENDAYTRYKYCHNTYDRIKPLKEHQVSPRITREIVAKYQWFYDSFYPNNFVQLRESFKRG